MGTLMDECYQYLNTYLQKLSNQWGDKTASISGSEINRLQSRLDARMTFYAAVVLLVLLIYVIQRLNVQRRGKKTWSKSRPSTPNVEKNSATTTTTTSSATKNNRVDQTNDSTTTTTTTNAGREFGVWEPSSFTRPTPPPYPDWSITDTKPLPYRPFRYGPKYFVTMGLRNVHFDDWIELDNHYPRYHSQKTDRIASRGDKCCKTAPEAFDAAMEFLQELCDYLPVRYPSMFERTTTGRIKNLWSGEEFEIDGPERKEDPMTIAARLIQDDLAIMIERPDGQYYLLAGAILLPGFWKLSDKFGMPLSEIHTSGDVPQFREKLERGMMNFFRRLKPTEMVARNNYFIQVDDNLAWSHSIGSEDADEASWSTAEKNKAIENHYFRSERQTLRRLPKTGGVVFTIRTYFEPVTKIVEEDYVPGRLASAVRSWGDDVSRYKGSEMYQDVLLEYLDRKHEEQVRRGLKVEEEDEKRSYPY